MSVVTQLVANGLIAGTSYALFALSFGLIYSASGFFHFAHGAVYAVCAYTAFALITLAGIPVWIAIPIALLATALFGSSIDYVVYRPLRARGATSQALLLVSIGLYVVVQAGLSMMFGPGTEILYRSATETTELLVGARVTASQLATMFAAIVAYLTLLVLLHRTKFGRQMRAVSESTELSRVLGIDTDSVISLTFALGSAIAGLAAVFAAYDTGLRPTMGFNALLVGIVAVVIGGSGSLSGAFWGGIAVGFAQQLGAWILPSRWQDVIVYLFLVTVLLLSPRGIARGTAPELVP